MGGGNTFVNTQFTGADTFDRQLPFPAASTPIWQRVALRHWANDSVAMEPSDDDDGSRTSFSLSIFAQPQISGWMKIEWIGGKDRRSIGIDEWGKSSACF